ncbi:MAG: S8 family peptidase, partial [Candidatus Sericytochromatia bacterium]
SKGEQLWEKGVSAKNVIVAVLDTGVDYNHPELQGRVVPGYDVADKDNDPMDRHGHGTHVAGIIGAARNNGEGISGVADCKIMPIKVLGDNGSGTTDSVLEGIKYAVDHGAKVINMSLGTSDPSIDPVLHMGLEYAYKKGVVVVAAAGNDGGKVGSPANDPYAIAVSSTSRFWLFEWRSFFSNRGDQIEVAAPGGGIWSLLPVGQSTLGAKQGRSMYGKLSGTSMAAPFVAGEAAMILAQHPNWTVEQVRNRIRQAVDDKGARGRDSNYGFGRINLAKALD